MIDLRIAMVLSLALVGACAKSESKPTHDTPKAVEPAVAPKAPLPPAKTVGHGEERVQWDVAGQRFDVGVVATQNKGADGVAHSVLRFTSAGKPLEIEVDANDDITLRVIDGGVLLRSQMLVARVQEVGALFANQAVFVEWDAKANKPTATKTWSCDETEAKDATCPAPAWAERT